MKQAQLIYPTPQFRACLEWLEERKDTNTNGLLYGDTYVGKSFAAKAFAASFLEEVEVFLTFKVSSLKSAALFCLLRHLDENFLGYYKKNTEEILAIVAQRVAERGIKLAIVEDVANFKPKYFERICQVLNQAGAAVVAIEFEPKIKWHLEKDTGLVRQLKNRFKLKKIDQSETDFILDRWQEKEELSIDRDLYRTLHYYCEGHIGTLMNCLYRAKFHSPRDRQSPGSGNPFAVLAQHRGNPITKPFEENLLDKSRSSYWQMNAGVIEKDIPTPLIDLYGDRDTAGIVQQFKLLELEAIEELACNYSLKTDRIIQEISTPSELLSKQQIPALSADLLKKRISLSAQDIAWRLGWRLEDRYTKDGYRIADTSRGRKFVNKLLKQGILRRLEEFKPYRYVLSVSEDRKF